MKCLTLLLFLIITVGESWGDSQAGASRVKITPPYSVYLAGLGNNRQSQGVHDDIYATAIYLSDGKTRLVIVSLDIIGLFYDYVDEARKEPAIKHRLKNTQIIIACTHVHSGPDTLGLWGPNEFTSGVNESYLQFLKTKIGEAIDEAIKSAKPAVLRVGEAEERNAAYNAREENLLDPSVTVLFAEDSKGKPIATMINYACHPEVLWNDNKLITSDYVHYLRELCEKRIGGITVFLNGALGGMVTPRVKEHTFGEARRIGESIGSKVIEAGRRAEVINNLKLTHRVYQFKLPVDNPRFLIASQMGVLNRKISGDGINSEMHFIDIGGKLQILTNPGEALPRVGFALKKLLHSEYKMIVGLACDEIGYILPQEDFGSQLYSYESSMSLGARTADIILGVGKKLVGGTLSK